jgi:hypothetical protein
MFKVDDLVFIRPTHSLKFSKRWGRIQVINPAEPLPFKVQFVKNGVLYGFTSDEMMSGREVLEWDKHIDHMECQKCGRDITGMYVTICEECENGDELL